MFLKRKRRVRLHLVAVPGAPETVEGIERGRRPVAGHHVLELPKVMQAGATHSLTSVLEVPADRVIFREVLSQ